MCSAVMYPPRCPVIVKSVPDGSSGVCEIISPRILLRLAGMLKKSPEIHEVFHLIFTNYTCVCVCGRSFICESTS